MDKNVTGKKGKEILERSKKEMETEGEIKKGKTEWKRATKKAGKEGMVVACCGLCDPTFYCIYGMCKTEENLALKRKV